MSYVNQKGVILIGLLLAVVIIALLFYGSSFLFNKNPATGQSNLKEIKDEMNEIHRLNDNQNARTEAALKDFDATSTK